MTREYTGIRTRTSTWQVFRKDMASARQQIRQSWEKLIGWIFVYTQRGGQRRTSFFIVISILLWIGIALISNPPGQSAQPIVGQIISALFSLDVLRQFLVLGLALWIGMRYAAVYLDDIFELGDVLVAERFIRQAAFANRYKLIRIKDGDVDPDFLKSPIRLIGGPGLVDVHLENAALFEQSDGEPHVIGPTEREKAVLVGFERLRKVVDLRDQVLHMTVNGRTQDGINVVAKDVQLVCSIYRGVEKWMPEPSFEQPYPFSATSIQNLVYRHKSSRGPWAEVMKILIREEMVHFISQHTLSEFLTNAYLGSQFIPREQIADLFYDFTLGFKERAEKQGIELHWIGIGTWETPSEIIPDRHIKAWNQTCENRMRRNQAAIEKSREDGRAAKLLALVDEITTSYSSFIDKELSREQVMRKLIRIYRKKLLEASSVYTNLNQPIPEELNKVIDHLTDLGAYTIGDP